MLLSVTLAMAVADFFKQRERAADDVERDAVNTIERLLAEFGERIKPAVGRAVAAIYIRYSTSFQDSFESQLRAILSEAIVKNLSIDKENIFYDLGVSGSKNNREGLGAIRKARKERRFQVFVALATSRLARNLKTLLEVLDEEFVGNGTRCILVDQRLDSEDSQSWKLQLPILGWLDEIQRTNQAGYVKAAHRMLLARRIYYSTATYGFGGQAIPNFFTKRGRPVRMIVVDDTTARVVNFIFDKYISGVSIGRIVQQLNADSQIPRPKKAQDWANKRGREARFSSDFVTKVLTCSTYVGVFVYNKETDVSDLSPDEMREIANSDCNVFSFPDLQIVSDVKFLKARQRLRTETVQSSSALSLPRSAESSVDRPMLLNGFLFCPSCDNRLVVTGSNGSSYGCKTCKFHLAVNQFLFSQMPRRLCTDLIVEAICEEVLKNQEIVDHSISQLLFEAERIQKPDPTRLVRLKKQRKETKDRLTLLLTSFKGDDIDLVKDQLNEFRCTLTKLDADISHEQAFVDQTASIPSKRAAKKLISEFAKVLSHFSCDGTSDALDKARELIGLLTGGRIEAFQCGEKKAKLGWLQVRFKINLAVVLMGQATTNSSVDTSVDVVVDIRKGTIENPKIKLARELYDRDYFENEIAAELGAGRASICNWIRQTFEGEGVPKPDGYQRRKRIEKARGLHHYQLISDEVFSLDKSGLLICEIANRLATNRDVITNSLRFAYEKRGLSWFDGRTRRKSLDSKSR